MALNPFSSTPQPRWRIQRPNWLLASQTSLSKTLTSPHYSLASKQVSSTKSISLSATDSAQTLRIICKILTRKLIDSQPVHHPATMTFCLERTDLQSRLKAIRSTDKRTCCSQSLAILPTSSTECARTCGSHRLPQTRSNACLETTHRATPRVKKSTQIAFSSTLRSSPRTVVGLQAGGQAV
jgi:hypothetical protein